MGGAHAVGGRPCGARRLFGQQSKLLHHGLVQQIHQVGSQRDQVDDVVQPLAVDKRTQLAGQRLQQHPGEHRMAVRAGIGHLLVGTASGQHLPRAAACVLAQERRRRRATPGQAQAAVAGIHHEHHVLGLHALGDVLDVGHRDRVGGELLRVRIHRDDVAKVAPGGELAGRTMAGEEHEHTVVLAGAVVGQAVVEGGQDVVAGGLLILQHDHLRRGEAELPCQRVGHRLRIVAGVLQLRPLGVPVDADHDRPRLLVAGGDGGVAGRALARAGDGEVAAVPAGELVAVGDQAIEDLRQRLHRAVVDVMEQDDAALFLVHLVQHALHDRFRHRIGPVHRVDVPHDRLQARFGEQLQAFGLARGLGEAEQRCTLAVDVLQQCVGVQHLLAQRIAGGARELGVGQAVVAHRIALFHQAAADLGHRPEADLAITLDLAQVATHLEAHARYVVALEDGHHFIGVGLVRAIVEGQHHGLRRQVAAEDLAVAVLHRHRVRLDHPVVAQDRFAAVVLVQVGDVVVPLLALQFDGTGALEAAEDPGLRRCAGAVSPPVATNRYRPVRADRAALRGRPGDRRRTVPVPIRCSPERCRGWRSAGGWNRATGCRTARRWPGAAPAQRGTAAAPHAWRYRGLRPTAVPRRPAAR
ncbi:hypothetical protein G6F65_013952 [Rhizopus arrhizus]|nr:hypothetical protein G6F65_013952 [Rhizopus arrhizus]